MPVNVDELGVDLLSLSAHKIYGPKGTGALYIRRGTPFRSMIIGGPQERKRRGGTHNAAGIVGLGTACKLLVESGLGALEEIRALRDGFEDGLGRRYPDCQILGTGAERLPNTTCVCFPGVSSEGLLLLLSEVGICVSSGAACSSGSLEPSHVLTAMRVDPYVAQGELRFSFGRFSTANDLSRLWEVLPGALTKVATSNI